MDDVVINKGDMLKVFQKVVEGKKERLTTFTGRVMNVKGSGDNRMITVRQTFEGVAVDKIYPIASPVIAKIEKLEEKKSDVKKQKKSAKPKTKKTRTI